MDSTLLGALIGLGGAALGAIATAVVPLRVARSQRREQLDRERRAAVADLVRAMVGMTAARGEGREAVLRAHTQAVIEHERVLMLATPRDGAYLEEAMVLTLNDVDVPFAVLSPRLEALSNTLRRWARGELRGKAIRTSYAAALIRQQDSRKTPH